MSKDSYIRHQLHCILLKNVPILEQLKLEEALLRTDDRSFCIINSGAPKSIVMGISGDPKQLLNLSKVSENNIPVVRRFSGGGTVIVDENTLFVTFIMSKKHLDIPPYPEPVLKWAFNFYSSAWNIPGFQLKENDYGIGDKKCGGNAQYMRKDRWIHHTSFLWDYEENNMEMLLLPPRRPMYRKDRSHDDFLCRLHSHGGSLENRITQIQEELVKRFYIQDLDLNSLQTRPHRQTTSMIELPA